MTPSPTSLPCPMGSSLSSAAPSPIPAMLHPPVPLSDLWGPLALSLLAGDMREVSLGMVASSICSSVIQLMPPAPGCRTCISLTVPPLAASAAAGRKPVGYCPQLPLALPDRGEGTVVTDGGGRKTQQLRPHSLDVCSLVMARDHSGLCLLAPALCKVAFPALALRDAQHPQQQHQVNMDLPAGTLKEVGMVLTSPGRGAQRTLTGSCPLLGHLPWP